MTVLTAFEEEILWRRPRGEIVHLTKEDGIITSVDHAIGAGRKNRGLGPILTYVAMMGLKVDPASKLKAGTWFEYNDAQTQLVGCVLAIERNHTESLTSREHFTAHLQIYCEKRPKFFELT